MPNMEQGHDAIDENVGCHRNDGRVNPTALGQTREGSSAPT